MKLAKPQERIGEDVQISNCKLSGPVGRCTRYEYRANVGVEDGSDFEIFEPNRPMVSESYDVALNELRAATADGGALTTQDITTWKEKLKAAQEAATAFCELDLVLRQKAGLFVNLPRGGVTKGAQATRTPTPEPVLKKPAPVVKPASVVTPAADNKVV